MAAQLLLNASAFHRRIVDPLSKYPQRLLLLGKSEDGVSCKLRQEVAKHLLETKPADLEINARKVQKLFSADLRLAADTGMLSGPLRVSVRTVAKMWKADSRECERVNKMLKLFTERGPTSSAELISSRACIKHYLGAACKPGATELLSSCPTTSRMPDDCYSFV